MIFKEFLIFQVSLPIGVTAMFPILFYPPFEIMTIKEVTNLYFQVNFQKYSKHFNFKLLLKHLKEISVLVYGGLVIAKAIEITGLHERVSLKILMHRSKYLRNY